MIRDSSVVFLIVALLGGVAIAVVAKSCIDDRDAQAECAAGGGRVVEVHGSGYRGGTAWFCEEDR